MLMDPSAANGIPMKSFALDVVTPRNGSDAVDENDEVRDNDESEFHIDNDEEEEGDVEENECMPSGDPERELADDDGCIRTRILPSSEGEVSKEMSRSPRPPSAASVPVNSSFRVVDALLWLSASRSIRELPVYFDQSYSPGKEL
ncbi:hypothetical protein NLJ89_g12365 [Agrocybe chaxingu]|uniref:Uncharacterized protein n=1 Tax=Agrocybe chaxingu TaxID=84603 RepID=A0A9W8JQM5_9AGAR|nr:hypothetical protein NLJ89_g12365 [Agrocybe chaxingu]